MSYQRPLLIVFLTVVATAQIAEGALLYFQQQAIDQQGYAIRALSKSIQQQQEQQRRLHSISWPDNLQVAEGIRDETKP